MVAALLLLQARGRVTAAELAKELEVSVKTARRDLESLSTAGLPVYARPGRGGGWQLLGGGRTDLSGLNAAETRALFLLAGPQTRLAPEAKSALRKLVRALPEPFREHATAAAEAVVLDAAGWGAASPTASPHLDVLQRAIIERVQVRLRYAGRSGGVTTRTVDPLGVAAKGGPGTSSRTHPPAGARSEGTACEPSRSPTGPRSDRRASISPKPGARR
jgi:predicted DNA-binding transcriptional regulator YafY